jgi:hypothetical protein
VKFPPLLPGLREMTSTKLKRFQIPFPPTLKSTLSIKGDYRDNAFDRTIEKIHVCDDLLHTLTHVSRMGRMFDYLGNLPYEDITLLLKVSFL